MLKDNYILEVEINAEGGKLAIMSVDGGDSYRIAGPKAWGGSRNIARLEISHNDLVTFIKEYAPDVLEELKNSG